MVLINTAIFSGSSARGDKDSALALDGSMAETELVCGVEAGNESRPTESKTLGLAAKRLVGAELATELLFGSKGRDNRATAITSNVMQINF